MSVKLTQLVGGGGYDEARPGLMAAFITNTSLTRTYDGMENNTVLPITVSVWHEIFDVTGAGFLRMLGVSGRHSGVAGDRTLTVRMTIDGTEYTYSVAGNGANNTLAVHTPYSGVSDNGGGNIARYVAPSAMIRFNESIKLEAMLTGVFTTGADTAARWTIGLDRG